jgi:hypothetical protein
VGDRFTGDATLAGLVSTWVSEGTCPVVLIDYLMDIDAYAAADLARAVCAIQAAAGRPPLPASAGNMYYLYLCVAPRAASTSTVYGCPKRILGPYRSAVVCGSSAADTVINAFRRAEEAVRRTER